MTRYTANDRFTHRTPPTTGVLLVQLGTPDEPEPASVRRYLKEFLSDPRVVEIPRLIWLPILHGIVLTSRPRKSAAKYRSIWTPHGSPLAVHTARQAALVKGLLGEQGADVVVAHAMRYGEPSVAAGLRELREQNATRLLVLPLYPQYAASTTGSVFDAVAAELTGWRNLPELRLVRGFHRDPGYIRALADSVRRTWERPGSDPVDGRNRKLVMSFHGLPRRSLLLGDPYHCECLATARLLAEELRLPADHWVATFQSRFGRASWLEPYTAPTLEQLARAGVRAVDVICPGFVADCLETLEEIGIEARDTFLAAGGTELRYIECLNETPAWIAALCAIAQRQMAGWPIARLSEPLQQQRAAALEQRELLALRGGAEK